MSDPVEVELKLDYDPADRDRLIASPLLGGTAAQSSKLVATYFDTPDQVLRKGGYALRVRRNGRQRIQTVKASGKTAGLFVRGEWERKVPGNQPILDDTAGPLHQFLDARDLDRIGPLFTTEVERVSATIERPGATSIEYAIDSGKVKAGSDSTALSEIEFELKAGAPAGLFDLARQLNEDVPLRLGVRSKSERGYVLVAGKLAKAVKAEPVLLDADDGAAEAFATIAASCLRQYRINEDILLAQGGVDALHQARVGLRRLRSALFLFKPLFADDKKAELFGAELRWLAGELGTIRDMDVLLPKLEEPARSALAAVRDSNFAHLRGLLDSGRVRLLPIDMAEWLAVGSWRIDPVDRDLTERNILIFAGERLDKLRKRIKREGHGLAHLDDEHRHRVRKDAKKLRYAAEFFVTLYPGRKSRRRLDRFLDRLEALQDKLGELNDIASAPDLLARFGLEADLPTLGRKQRKRLLEDAGDCFEELIDSKRFWRS